MVSICAIPRQDRSYISVRQGKSINSKRCSTSSMCQFEQMDGLAADNDSFTRFLVTFPGNPSQRPDLCQDSPVRVVEETKPAVLAKLESFGDDSDALAPRNSGPRALSTHSSPISIGFTSHR